MDSNFFYNTQNIQIQALASRFQKENYKSKKEMAIAIYEYVRDEWYYSPLRLSLIPEEWQVDYLIKREKGHCIDKSILLITLLKALNFKARLGLAKVRNHIAAERVVAFLGTDVLVPHGYVEILIEHKWVKATPAFNKSLCEKLGVEVLTFNGEEDSIFQKFGKNGDQLEIIFVGKPKDGGDEWRYFNFSRPCPPVCRKDTIGISTDF